jgi:diguanylate cyclase (GGDEF)-like protein/PAS domain S-box-containing protein
VQQVLDLDSPLRAIIDLFAELDGITMRISERALALSGADVKGRDLADFQQERLDRSAGLDTIVRRAAEVARRLSGADGAMVEVTDSAGAVHSAGEGPSTGRAHPAMAEPAHLWLLTTGSAPLICDDTETDPRVDRKACHRLATRSLITVPLRHRDANLGAITVTSSRPHAFNEAHSELLQLLAGPVRSTVLRVRLVADLRDVDRNYSRALTASEALFRRLFFENPQPMWVIDAETERFLAVNDAAVAVYGYSAEEFATLTIAAIRRDAARLTTDLNRARAGKTAFTARHRRRDGRLIDVEVTVVAQEFNGRPGLLSIVNDVTERNRLDRQLRESAFRDPLTGGANRALFAERVAHALTRMRRRSATTAVLVIDLDHFKDVNESMGRAYGDALLQAAAARIQATLRPGDTVARLDADEFAVLLEEVGHPDSAVEAAERLDEAFESSLEFAGNSLVMSLSIGIATSSTARIGAETLLGNAELAMYAAKAAGRGRAEVFVPSMQATATERLSLDQDLRHAVERGELRLFYQPLISVDSGDIAGCEALVRWQHPVRGLVPPDSFIPLAEETGVISAIDTWVLRTACAQLVAWRQAGYLDLFVAVNVSGRELGRADLVDRVEAAVFESGLPPDRLEVEITETTVAAQPMEALQELRQLRRAGISVAIDDFGTGYSSFSKLATFPVDRIKIDRSFLSSIKQESDDDPLVAAMIGMAHRLGLQVTAEGVETSAQLAFLRRNGCDLLQGFLFSRPVPADGFEELLERSPQRAWTA